MCSILYPRTVAVKGSFLSPFLASLRDGTAYANRQDPVKPPSYYTRQRNGHTVVGPSPARKGSKKTGDAIRGLILLL